MSWWRGKAHCGLWWRGAVGDDVDDAVKALTGPGLLSAEQLVKCQESKSPVMSGLRSYDEGYGR